MKSNYLELVRSVYSGISQRQTAAIYGVSRNTVALAVRFAQQQGWHTLADLEKINPSEFQEALTGLPGTIDNRDKSFALPDYQKVHEELAKEHVTLRLLWEEYVKDCIQKGKRYYMETQFRVYYRQFAQKNKATIRLQHKPGMAVQVDWAGSTIGYFDEDLTAFAEGHLFVGILPCSNLIYAEVFPDETLPNWIQAHVNMFDYFGGVPKTLVPDNLKTGVKKPNFYEPDINQTYLEMANFYGTAVLPARVRKPKDKGQVENAVKIASTQILARLRNKQMDSFRTLHKSVQEALEQLNKKPLTGKNVSRWNAFNSEEKEFLLTLPRESYELATWSKAIVQPNCHVAHKGYFYSVPFEYLGETVDLRATRTTLEVFYHHERLASHLRLYGKQQYSTVKDHMPPDKLFFVDWDAERFLQWAGNIGPHCREVIQRLLNRYVIEQHAYRGCFGILSLKDKYSEQRLEKACEILLLQTLPESYSQIKRILERKEDLTPRTKSAEAEGPKGFQRGREYYQAGDEKN